jgi:hypothetical protein
MSTIVWVIVIIVLVLLAVYLFRMVAGRGRRL